MIFETWSQKLLDYAVEVGLSEGDINRLDLHELRSYYDAGFTPEEALDEEWFGEVK